MTETVPLPKAKPVVPRLPEFLTPDIDPGALIGALSEHLPFLLFVAVIAIAIHVIRNLAARLRSTSTAAYRPAQSWPKENSDGHATPRSTLPQRASTEMKESSAEPTQVDQSPQDDWRRLCSYARRCVQAEAAQSLMSLGDEGRSWFGHAGSEQLIVGHTDTVRAPTRLATSLDSSTDSPWQASLLYGWPTLVLRDRKRGLCVAPLFLVQIEADQNAADGEWQLHATTEPEFNQAIAASSAFEDSVTEQVADLLGTGWPFGDPDACANCAIRAAGSDRPHRTRSARPGASQRSHPTPGGHLQHGPYRSTLRRPTTTTPSSTNWRDLRSAMTGRRARPPTSSAPRPNRLSALPLHRHPSRPPLLCNQSQEHALQHIRTHPLTIVTGPPGTGKTELVVNAVCNAWLDGEKVLVTSTNNAAVDVAVDRAVERVFSGLLIRTGNRKVREDVPGRIGDALDAATPILASPISSPGTLREIADDRAGLSADLERLNATEGDLLARAHQLETVQNELNNAVRRLWHLDAPSVARRDPRRIEDRANRVLNARFLRGFRSRRLRKKIRCLHSAPISRIHTWARLEQERSSLARSIEALKQTSAGIENSVGDVTTAVPALNEKWAEISLNVVRQHVATKFAFRSTALERFFVHRGTS